MSNPIPSPDVLQQTYALLRAKRNILLPWAGTLFLLFGLANMVRAVFPGLYVFDPFDLGWLLIPEAIVFGPVVALMTHRILGPEKDFAWSRDNLLVKLGKAAAYYYVLLILFTAGAFASTQFVPAIFGYLLGPVISPIYPVLVGGGFVGFLLVYVRLLLVYPVLAGDEREPLVQSMALTKGKGMKIGSCLLLLATPVLIPWVAVSTFAGNWLDPTYGEAIRFLPIIVRTLLQTVGVILISTGLCVIYEALLADDENDGDNINDA